MKRIGDWDKMRRITRTQQAGIQRTLKTNFMQLGSRAERYAVLYLRNQSLSWQPLSPRYAAQKKRRGESEKTLIRSSTYLQSITSWTESSLNKLAVFAGVKKQVTYKDGSRLADIVKVQEYGSVARNIPERPLWQPVANRMRTYVKVHGNKLFVEPVLNFLRNI